jgi:hypothetical protein
MFFLSFFFCLVLLFIRPVLAALVYPDLEKAMEEQEEVVDRLIKSQTKRSQSMVKEWERKAQHQKVRPSLLLLFSIENKIFDIVENGAQCPTPLKSIQKFFFLLLVCTIAKYSQGDVASFNSLL